VRIEDDILDTAKGCDILSKRVPKTLADIEALVG
jgi:Xaa-Pro aminopeptidase